MEPGASQPSRRLGAVAGWCLVAAAICLTAVLIWFPLDDLFLGGVYGRQLAQAAAVEGGAELVALFAACFVLLVIGKRYRWAGVAVVALAFLYLRRHHVDLPAAVGLLYFEMIVAIGGVVLEKRGVRCASPVSGILSSFLVGFVSWSLIALVLSAVGLGTPSALRVMTLLVGVPAVCLRVGHLAVLQLVRGFPPRSAFDKALASYVLVLLLCLLARSNVVVDFDSIWYGLRSEHVLVQEHSFFEPLGLVYTVYYYPKLFELFALPLSGLGDYSFVYVASIMAFGLLLLTVHAFLREMGCTPQQSLVGAALVGSVPAVANMAVTAKPDVFASFLLLLGALHLRRYLGRRSLADALLSMSAIVLAYGCKLTAVPYGTLLLLAVAACVLWDRLRRRDAGAGADVPVGLALATLVGATIVLGAIFYRTYLLTGLPILDHGPINGILQSLGFRIEYPIASAPGHDLSKVSILTRPELFRAFFFAPSVLPHVRYVWTGNVVLYLLLVVTVLVAGRALRPRQMLQTLPFVPVMAAGIYFAFFFVFVERIPGGDGNYYIVPVALATTLGCGLAFRSRWRIDRLMLATLTPFVVLHSVLILVSGPGWRPGTRTLDLDLLRSPFDTAALKRSELSVAGLLELEEFLQGVPPGERRAVGIGVTQQLHMLSGRFESVREFRWARPELLETPESFIKLLDFAEIGFLIVPLPRRQDVVDVVFDRLRREPGARVIRSRLYLMLDLREVPRPLATTAIRRPERDRRALELDMVSELDDAQLFDARPAEGGSGRTILLAPKKVNQYAGARSLLLRTGAAVGYDTTLSAAGRFVIDMQVGFDPFSPISDGDGGLWLRVVHSDGTVLLDRRYDVPSDEYVAIETFFDVEEAGSVRVEVHAVDRAAGRGDWLVLIGPRVWSMPAGTTSGRPTHD